MIRFLYKWLFTRPATKAGWYVGQGFNAWNCLWMAAASWWFFTTDLSAWQNAPPYANVIAFVVSIVYAIMSLLFGLMAVTGTIWPPAWLNETNEETPC